MNKEEKAKAYDEAIERAKGVIEQNPLMEYLKKGIEYIFPELKESEDERIRKELIKFVKVNIPDEERYIAWLEKQGEKAQGKTALEAWKDMRFEVYQQASGNRHEPNCSDDATKMFSLTDIDEIFEKIAEKQGEQKPADKIEPSAFKDKLLELFQKFRYKEDIQTNGEILEYVDAHIQELLNTLQKQEWSEEDNKNLEKTVWYVEKGGKLIFQKTDKLTSWLKSLKGRYTWKPSDEQMKALNEVVNYAANHENMHWNDYIFGTLNGLVKQLKNLTE